MFAKPCELSVEEHEDMERESVGVGIVLMVVPQELVIANDGAQNERVMRENLHTMSVGYGECDQLFVDEEVRSGTDDDDEQSEMNNKDEVADAAAERKEKCFVGDMLCGGYVLLRR